MSFAPANHSYHDMARPTPPGCPQCGTSGGVADRGGLVCATCGMPLEAPHAASTARPSPAGPKHARPTPEGVDAGKNARRKGA